MVARWTFEGRNPIVGYSIGFELAGILSPDALRQVSALGPALAKDLPRKVDQQAITFQMGVFQPSSQPHRAIGGVVFDELDRDGTVLKQLIVSPNSVTYHTARYERWAEYWPVAERILNLVANVIMHHTGVSGFLLNAANKFELSGDQTILPMDELIRPGCRFIAPDLLEKKGPCHCFYGFMSDFLDPPGKRIDNVNFSVGAGDPTPYWVDLVINVRLILNEPIRESRLLFGRAPAQGHRATDIFGTMHEVNNALFADILTQDLCDTFPGISRP
jgi:hypothetical protein